MTKKDLIELMNSMTLEEKVGQLLQILPHYFNEDKHGSITGPLAYLRLTKEQIWNSGSVIGVSNAKDMIEIQTEYMNKGNKIPLMFMFDVIHGFRTIFPVPLGIACTWDMKCMEESSRIAAIEASLAGIHVSFSPMADLVRDPRWGRVMEGTGEDPYLNSLFSVAALKGYQGDFTQPYNIAACVKHFAAYGASEAGRDYNTVDVSDRTLREYYLPAYRAAVDAGCEMVMASFNTVHGIPSSGNQYLLRNILREEWGFEGVVISDWGSVGELISHGVAKDEKAATKLGMEAGVDIDMMTPCYIHNLCDLVREEKVDEKLLDEAVYRILKLKDKLGLFENPFRFADPQKAEETFVNQEFRKTAREIAAKSMVLLKNDGMLPLQKDKKVAIIGPHADNCNILGPWSAIGKAEETISLYRGICDKIGSENVRVEKGCDFSDTSEINFEKAIEAAKWADVVLLALGEEQNMSGEAASRAYITLPGVQEELANEIFKLKKPTTLVLMNGRPLEIGDLAEKASAILEAWFPGTEGGNAIADILYADVNPSGRLTMSIPRTIGQIPVYYNYYNTGRPWLTRYIDTKNEPLFPFGYGLSYTGYEYSNLQLDKTTMKAEDTIKARVWVKNTGERTGIETVQLYIRDMVGNTVRPVKELKGYQQITLEPGEEKQVIFDITVEMLKYHDFYNNYKAEAGDFCVMVGSNSADVMSMDFELID